MFAKMNRAVLQRASFAMGKRSMGSGKSYVAVDSSTDALKVFHWTGILLAVHVPIAFCGFMPPMIQSIMDDSLSVLFPLHGFIGVNTVISDYVPGKLTAPARVLAFVSALVSMAGLYKLGMGDGPGLSQTVKNLWVKPKKE